MLLKHLKTGKMQISINNTWITIPSSLSEITLKQKIDFQKQYGDSLLEMAKSIHDMPDGFEKELEMTQFQVEQMFKTMAFFCNCTEQALKESEFIDKIAGIYYSCLSQLNEQNELLELQQSHVWNEEEWFIDHPELKNGDRMTFGEFIDAKQIIQDMVNVGNNRWECLLPLCAIFLRKKGEAYDESFLFEDSERLKLMQTLPFNIALNVGFFLTSSLNMYIEAFRFSPNQEQKEVVSM